MPVLTTVDQLLDLVRKSRLVEEARLAEVISQVDPSAADAASLSKTLVEHGLITAWQAGQLLAGKWRGFLIAGGKYKLLDLLGVGGMGKVYLCEHCRMQRLVALKILPIDRLHEPTSLERFEREARAAGALHHVNIVRAFDLDRDGDLHFLVMEYVDGASLHQIVKKSGPLEIRRACHYISQAAEGLQHAHEAARLVHRDIKPGNILVDRSGTVKILDMGLARFFQDEEGSLTRRHDRNAVLGTADYLAPEQALNSSTVDIRADIYSLGATFYYILAGRNLFDRGSVAEKLIWHQVREPAPLRTLRSNVPRDLEAVIARMMAKKPDARFQEPIEVVAALERWTSEPVDPPPEVEMPQRCPALHSLAPSGGGSSSGSGRGSSARSTKSLRAARTQVAPAGGGRWTWLVPAGILLAAAAALLAWWSRLPSGAPPAIRPGTLAAPPADPRLHVLPGPDALPPPADGALFVTADPRLQAAAAGRADVVNSFGQALALAGLNQRIVMLDGRIEGQFRVDGRTAGLVIEGRGPGITWAPAEGAAPDEPLLTLMDSAAARVSGITFDGGGHVHELIRVEGDAAGLRLDNLRLTGARSAQLALRAFAANADRPVEIESVRFTADRCPTAIAVTGSGAASDIAAATVVNCRFEGAFDAAVRIDAPVDLDLRRCRFWAGREPGESGPGDAVSLETSAPGRVRLRLASSTAAGWASLLRVRRLPGAGSTVQLRSNLLIDGPAFVAADGGIEVDRLRELMTPSAGNVARRGQGGAGVPATPLQFVEFGSIERRPETAGFLLYSRTGDAAALLTAGADGEPAGVPPPE